MNDEDRQVMRDIDSRMIAERKEEPMFWSFFFLNLPLSYPMCWFASWVDRDTDHFRVTGWDYLWVPPILALVSAFMMWAIIKRGEERCG